jgi:hypothetical protein
MTSVLRGSKGSFPLLKAEHPRRLRVLDLEPGLAWPRPTGTVIAALRDDALATEPAGVGEDGCAVAVEVLAVADAGWHLGDQLLETRLPLRSGRGRQSSPSSQSQFEFRMP